jgi:hypothetical protein
VADKHLVFHGHAFANKGMARNFAPRPNPRAFLDRLRLLSRQMVYLADFLLPFPFGTTCYGSVSGMFVRCNCLPQPFGIGTLLQLHERSVASISFFYLHSHWSGLFIPENYHPAVSYCLSIF